MKAKKNGPVLTPKKDVIIAAIRHDEALIAGALVEPDVKVCNHIGHCAIGALLAFAGVTDETLVVLPATPGGLWYQPDALRKLVQEPHDRRVTVTLPTGKKLSVFASHLLEEVYGLDRENANRIMSINDGCAEKPGEDACAAAKRRAKVVIDFVRKEL